MSSAVGGFEPVAVSQTEVTTATSSRRALNWPAEASEDLKVASSKEPGHPDIANGEDSLKETFPTEKLKAPRRSFSNSIKELARRFTIPIGHSTINERTRQAQVAEARQKQHGAVDLGIRKVVRRASCGLFFPRSGHMNADIDSGPPLGGKTEQSLGTPEASESTAANNNQKQRETAPAQPTLDNPELPRDVAGELQRRATYYAEWDDFWMEQGFGLVCDIIEKKHMGEIESAYSLDGGNDDVLVQIVMEAEESEQMAKEVRVALKRATPEGLCRIHQRSCADVAGQCPEDFGELHGASKSATWRLGGCF